MDPDFNPPFLISGGPLSYTYRVHYIKLHFGRVDQIGSEHTVSGKPFPLEVSALLLSSLYLAPVISGYVTDTVSAVTSPHSSVEYHDSIVYLFLLSLYQVSG